MDTVVFTVGGSMIIILALSVIGAILYVKCDM